MSQYLLQLLLPEDAEQATAAEADWSPAEGIPAATTASSSSTPAAKLKLAYDSLLTDSARQRLALHTQLAMAQAHVRDMRVGVGPLGA